MELFRREHRVLGVFAFSTLALGVTSLAVPLWNLIRPPCDGEEKLLIGAAILGAFGALLGSYLAVVTLRMRDAALRSTYEYRASAPLVGTLRRMISEVIPDETQQKEVLRELERIEREWLANINR